MGTITGLTAERMQEIIDSTIVNADIIGGSLILTKEDGSTMDAGSVLASPVPKGSAFPGSPTDGDLFVRTDQAGDPLYKYTDGAWVQFGADAFTRILKAADETVNNSNVLQDDNHLVLPVLAGQVFKVDYHLILSATSTTPDWNTGFTAPAGSQFYWGNEGNGTGAGTLWGGSPVASSPTRLQTLADGMQFGSMNGIHGLHLSGIYIGGANPGDLKFRWAQNTPTAADSKVLANSMLIAQKLA